MLRTGLVWISGILIAVLYVFAAVTAVGNLLGMLGLAEEIGVGLSVTGLIFLVIGITMPLLVLVLALMLGRGRPPGMKILLLVAGIALVAALQIDLMHLVPESFYVS